MAKGGAIQQNKMHNHQHALSLLPTILERRFCHTIFLQFVRGTGQQATFTMMKY